MFAGKQTLLVHAAHCGGRSIDLSEKHRSATSRARRVSWCVQHTGPVGQNFCCYFVEMRCGSIFFCCYLHDIGAADSYFCYYFVDIHFSANKFCWYTQHIAGVNGTETHRFVSQKCFWERSVPRCPTWNFSASDVADSLLHTRERCPSGGTHCVGFSTIDTHNVLRIQAKKHVFFLR